MDFTILSLFNSILLKIFKVEKVNVKIRLTDQIGEIFCIIVKNYGFNFIISLFT